MCILRELIIYRFIFISTCSTKRNTEWPETTMIISTWPWRDTKNFICKFLSINLLKQLCLSIFTCQSPAYNVSKDFLFIGSTIFFCQRKNTYLSFLIVLHADAVKNNISCFFFKVSADNISIHLGIDTLYIYIDRVTLCIIWRSIGLSSQLSCTKVISCFLVSRVAHHEMIIIIKLGTFQFLAHDRPTQSCTIL